MSQVGSSFSKNSLISLYEDVQVKSVNKSVQLSAAQDVQIDAQRLKYGKLSLTPEKLSTELLEFDIEQSLSMLASDVNIFSKGNMQLKSKGTLALGGEDQDEILIGNGKTKRIAIDATTGDLTLTGGIGGLALNSRRSINSTAKKESNFIAPKILLKTEGNSEYGVSDIELASGNNLQLKGKKVILDSEQGVKFRSEAETMSLYPQFTDSFDIGSETLRYRKIYTGGLDATSLTISGWDHFGSELYSVQEGQILDLSQTQTATVLLEATEDASVEILIPASAPKGARLKIANVNEADVSIYITIEGLYEEIGLSAPIANYAHYPDSSIELVYHDKWRKLR